jgi:hypothetical protein
MVLTAPAVTMFDSSSVLGKEIHVAHDDAGSAIEKVLGFEFVSDPRKSKFPLPEIPRGHPKDMPFPHKAQEITPEMAGDILKYRVIRLSAMPKRLKHDKMTSNRSFLMAALKGSRNNKGLIRTIQDDEWNPRIASPMVFTREGFLLDGQHRAAAAFLAKKSIWVPVTVNGQWDTFAVTDTNRGRNAGQLLGDVPYAHYCAAAAKLILPVIHGVEKSEWQISDATNQEIYDLVHDWPFFHESWENGGSWMREVVQAAASRIPLSALAASTMMALAAGADVYHVQSFLSGLKPGYSEGFPSIGDKGKDPRFLLRKLYLVRSGGSKSVTDLERRQQVGHVRRAMQIWLDYRMWEESREGPGITELSQLRSVSEHSDLPEVWRADDVRKFHQEKVA